MSGINSGNGGFPSGGGGSYSNNYNNYGGGGGGGFSMKTVTGLTPGSSISVTVGAGGTVVLTNQLPGFGGRGLVIMEY